MKNNNGVKMVKKKGLPRWGELVLCTVNRITPFAAWCTLDEYEKEDGSAIEGMIHISEVAGKWVKDIRKFVKPNKQYVAKVVRIDYQKGHLNLSLKRVSKFDKREKMEKYRREKRASGMLTQIAKRVGRADAEVHKELEMKFKEALGEQFVDMFTVFEQISEEPEILDKIEISKELKGAINDVIERNFRTKEKTIKAILKIMSAAPDGVKKIRHVLAELEKETGATVKYISAPKYQVEIKTKNPKEAEKKLESGLQAALEKIKQADGEGSYEFIR